MERRLGRGLGSLLREVASSDRSPSAEIRPHEIELDQLRPNPHQPRQTFDPEGLDELVQSVRAHGVLQPIAVREVSGGYEIIAGERRVRAAREVGLERIPAVVREVADEEMLELALVENVQRRDLDPIERAEGYRKLQQALGLTQELVASRVGLKRATVTNHLRLLELPEQVQDAVRQGMITMGHARALLGLPDEAAQLAMLARTVRQELSVRALEGLVRDLAEPAAASEPKAPERAAPWIHDAERRMRDHLGARVRLQNSAGYRGKILIEYANKETLERLLEQLGPQAKV